MRVTAEQFAWRKENRVTGTYVSKPPSAYHRRPFRLVPPAMCNNCGRETEILFDGFVYPVDNKGEPLSPEQTAAVMALSAPFQITPGQVCMRCRPPSNLEIQEMLSDAKTTTTPIVRQTLENGRAISKRRAGPQRSEHGRDDLRRLRC